MKKMILILFVCIISMTASAQFVARMEIKEPVAGLCDEKEVYVMLLALNDKDQQEAVCPVTTDQIQERLNNEVQYLKDNPGYGDDKGILNMIINCKGDVVQCKMDNKTRSPELDKQIENVFKTLGNWQPGKLKKRAVDTAQLFGFKIVSGKILLD